MRGRQPDPNAELNDFADALLCAIMTVAMLMSTRVIRSCASLTLLYFLAFVSAV